MLDIEEISQNIIQYIMLNCKVCYDAVQTI